MALVFGLSAERMLEIEGASVVGGLVNAQGNLILRTHSGEYIDAGYVKGAPGNPGANGVAAKITSATATAVAAGGNPTVTLGGTDQERTLAFGIPRGANGTNGTNGTDASIPAGVVNLYTGITAPTNWMFCQGQAISRTTYAALYAVIGTRYGVGDGSTTFNLPDLRGRVPVGLNAGDSDFNTLGLWGGAKTASHRHALSDEGWARIVAGTNIQYNGSGTLNGIAVQYKNLGGVAGDVWTADARSSGAVTMIASSISVNHGAILDGFTENASASTMQPWMVFNYIIKVTAGATPGDPELATRVAALEANAGTLTDTPHTLLPLANGYSTAADQLGLGYSISGDLVTITGAVTGTYAAGTYQVVSPVGSLPTNLRPRTNPIRAGAMGSGMRQCGMEINPNGSVIYGHNQPTAPTWIQGTITYKIGT